MKRVLVIGPPGSGKSTMARKLADAKGLPLVHLDQLWWSSGWIQRSREEFLAGLKAAVAGEEWVIDGNFASTLQERIDRADTVIYLDFPTAKCLCRACKRILRNYGKVRSDMAPGCPEKFNWEFLCFIATFRRRVRPEIEAILAGNQDRKVHRLRSQPEIDALVRSFT